jgi:predicted short-subunit dehydrogenase-like oxidoreductase (DUF2520 family)
MASKPTIAIIGPGRLGCALGRELQHAGYRITEIVAGNSSASRRKARVLAKTFHAMAAKSSSRLEADVVWFCVPDREIAKAAGEMAGASKWKGKVAFHSSGALASDELSALRQRGAAVAAVHPMMTFVRGSVPSLQGVPVALEGDARAMRAAGELARDLGAKVFSISKTKKSAYHAWGAFASPLLISLLVSAERVAQVAGISRVEARKKMLPMVRQTLANYAKLGPEAAFSGPVVRGDADVVRQHLRELKKIPEAREVYVAMVRAALRYLPVRNRKDLEKILRD